MSNRLWTTPKTCGRSQSNYLEIQGKKYAISKRVFGIFILLGLKYFRSRQSYTGIPSSVTKVPTSRPSSRMSQGESPFGSVAGRDLRPSSYAGPQNTVGLPSSLNTSLIDSRFALQSLDWRQRQLQGFFSKSLTEGNFHSRIPKLNGSFGTPQISKSSSGEHHLDNGLLTTIEKAAFSDEESPPPLPSKNDSSLRKSSLPVSASPLTSTR